MNLKLHIFLRGGLWFLCVVFGFVAIAVYQPDKDLAVRFLIGGFVSGLVLSYIVYKFIGAICSACGHSQMFGDSFGGRLAYNCKNCNHHITTSVIFGSSASNHLVGPWSDGMPGGKKRLEKAIAKKNQRELERIRTGGKVNMRKPLMRKLWDKLFPLNY